MTTKIHFLYERFPNCKASRDTRLRPAVTFWPFQIALMNLRHGGSSPHMKSFAVPWIPPPVYHQNALVSVPAKRRSHFAVSSFFFWRFVQLRPVAKRHWKRSRCCRTPIVIVLPCKMHCVVHVVTCIFRVLDCASQRLTIIPGPVQTRVPSGDF